MEGPLLALIILSGVIFVMLLLVSLCMWIDGYYFGVPFVETFMIITTPVRMIIPFLKKHGFINYRIIYTTKGFPEGIYILQESTFKWFWKPVLRRVYKEKYYSKILEEAKGNGMEALEDLRQLKRELEKTAAAARPKIFKPGNTRIIE